MYFYFKFSLNWKVFFMFYSDFLLEIRTNNLILFKKKKQLIF
jgi:hypothetical protein